MKKAISHILFVDLFISSVLCAQTANFSKLRHNHISDDFTLVSKLDGGKHTCIKAVLCLNSEYFDTVIKSSFLEATQNIMILDHSSEAIRIILDFIYDQRRRFLAEPTLPLKIYGELLAFSDYGFANNLKMALRNIPVSFSLNQENFTLALETIRAHKDYNLLTQLFAKVTDAFLDTDKFEIDDSWLTHLMGLDLELNQKKKELYLKIITLDRYLALRQRANKSNLNNLNKALDSISLHLEPEEITLALMEGVDRDDIKLLLAVLQLAKSESNPNEKFINIILEEIERENPLIVKGLRTIRSSELWNYLWINYETLLMDTFPIMSGAKTAHILNMAEWRG